MKSREGSIIRKFVGAVATVVAAFVLSTSVFAQSPAPGTESITISPVSNKITADAGVKVDGELTVVNDGNTAYDFTVYARPYSIQNDNYDNPNFTIATKNTEVYQWVQFQKSSYHLEANKTVKIPYTIRIPATANPGGHYGVIFAETQPSGPVSGNAVVRKKRVGMILYTTVNGDVQNTGQATGGDIPFWQLQPPLEAKVTAKNTGNNDFLNNTNLVVKDIFGNIKYQSQKDYRVLPDTSRTSTLQWSDAPWFGFYNVQVSEKFLDQSLSRSGYVLIMPRFLPVIFIAVILVGFIYAAYHRRRK
jgi:hypothetical protein